MEQDNKKFEFKAIDRKVFAFPYLMVLPLFAIIYYIMSKYIFEPDFFSGSKNFQLPLGISLISSGIISHLLFVKKYTLEITDYELFIYLNNSILYSFPYEQIKGIKFRQSKRAKFSSLHFYADKKIVLIMGYFLCSKNDFCKYNIQVEDFIEDYLIKTDLDAEIIDRYYNTVTLINKNN